MFLFLQVLLFPSLPALYLMNYVAFINSFYSFRRNGFDRYHNHCYLSTIIEIISMTIKKYIFEKNGKSNILF